MQKEDWIRLAMPASISLLAVAIMTVPLIVKAAGVTYIEGTTTARRYPIYVKLVD